MEQVGLPPRSPLSWRTLLDSRRAVSVMCVLVPFIGVLALATSASAEGAWTLWMMGASSPWDSVGTFSTPELCMEALHQQAQAVEKLGLKVTEDAAAGSFLATGADQDIRGQCLPDTDDPRRPKGK